MKLLKITGILFVATLIFSAVLQVSAGTLTFAGITIAGHGVPHYSSEQKKENSSAQSFKLISAYDFSAMFSQERNIRVKVENRGTSALSEEKELAKGQSYTFTANSTKSSGTKYRVQMKTANILSGSVYLNATWTYN